MNAVDVLPDLPEERQPMQTRSRASLTRMLDAAQLLLTERGSDNFTLSDVSRVGKVSIGSIYHRFESKDELLRAVHRAFMAVLDEEQSGIVQRAATRSGNLPRLLAILIEDITEFLKRHAPPLRPMMACAGHDNAILTAGKLSQMRLMDQFTDAVVAYRAEIRHPDPAAAARNCFMIVYGHTARDLGLEALHTATPPEMWPVLKANLFDICLAYLTTAPVMGFRGALEGKA